MMEFLEKLKQKPQHVKTRIFFAVMAAAFFLVVFLWLMSAGNSLGNLSEKKSENGIFSEKIELPNISDSLKASAAAIFEGKEVQVK